MPKIFISYRRDDNKAFVERIHDRLVVAFGEENVFQDTKINAGAEWKEVLKRKLDESDVLLVVIGGNWERIMRQRSAWYLLVWEQLFGTNLDWVRYEIEQGLARGNSMLLIPVLIEDTKLPDNLPKSIQKLKNYQTSRVRGAYDFEPHMDRLVKELKKYPALPATIPYTTSAQAPERGGFSHLNIAIFMLIIVAIMTSAFIFLPTLFGNSPRETQLTDNPVSTEAATENTIVAADNTDVPTHEPSPSETPTVDNTSSPTTTSTNQPTASVSPSPEPTLNEEELRIEQAWSFSGLLNSDWTPYIYSFEDGVEMALVPVGCFQLGNDPDALRFLDDPDAGEVRAVPDGGTICLGEPLWIDETEVTQADFIRLGGEKRIPIPSTELNTRPVQGITWVEARDYCARVGKRLPTEVEWEYAARGIENWLFPWGNSFEPEKVLYGGNSGGRTGAVETYANGASWVGALHMSGNVFEWMGNIYLNQNELDLTNIVDHRPLRGGSWGTSNESRLRAASRSRAEPGEYADDSVGFRCVRDID